MYKHKKKTEKTAVLIVVMLAFVLTLALVPPAKSAKFVLAAWSYPDEYGQGIYGYRIYENSTGDWESFGYEYQVGTTMGTFYFVHPDTFDVDVFDWTAGVFIKLRFYFTLNSTLTGATDLTNGKNYFRHSIIVIDLNESTVFSQQNFTYYDNEGEDEGIYYYLYDIILDFEPVQGDYYTATVTYEVYW